MIDMEDRGKFVQDVLIDRLMQEEQSLSRSFRWVLSVIALSQ
jgi:hypothetical protein